MEEVIFQGSSARRACERGGVSLHFSMKMAHCRWRFRKSSSRDGCRDPEK
jgi:hypothetical protein